MEQYRQSIMIADEREISRSVLVDILGSDYEIVEAENGAQVLDLLNERGGAIDLLMLGVAMPRVNGYQVLTELKTRGWLEKIPVIMIVGEDRLDQVERAYRMGADDHVHPPFNARVIRQRVACNLMLYAREKEWGCIRPWRTWIEAPSDRTINLLEREWKKHQFFASLSREIQFEYIAQTDTLRISNWGADYLGLDRTEIRLGQSDALYEVTDPRDVEAVRRRLRASTPEDPEVEYHCSILVKGERRWGKILAMSLWSSSQPPEYVGAVGKFVDTHEEHSRIQVLERLASHDGLTGLLNRDTVSRQIDTLLETYPEKKYALAVVDLDYFKEANDKHGHLFGDQVLKFVADKLRKSIRSTDLAARVGGDEFLVFMEYTDQVHPQVDRVFRSLSGSFGEFQISVSMGIARSPMHMGEGYQVLFRRADQALYAAKRKGRNCYCFYDETMRDLLSVLSPIESDGNPDQQEMNGWAMS